MSERMSSSPVWRQQYYTMSRMVMDENGQFHDVIPMPQWKRRWRESDVSQAESVEVGGEVVIDEAGGDIMLSPNGGNGASGRTVATEAGEPATAALGD